MRAFYLNTINGLKVLTEPLIASTTILNVKREGIGYNEVSSSPGARDFVYDPTGKLSFSNEFENEKVYVLCL